MINTPPTILEEIAESPAGRVNRALLADGREVAAVQVVLADSTAVEAASDRLRRLARINDQALAPVLGWWVDGTTVWYLTELDEGLSFSRFPSAVVLSPQQSVALSLGILQGLDALYDEGLSHGALGAANVRVDDRGRVRLAGHPLAILHFPSDSELVAEVRMAGRLVCDAFGIPVEKSPGPPRAIEHAAPALVIAARSIANGTLGHDVKGAAASIRDTAGPLASRERLALGLEELGALVGGREPDRTAAPPHPLTLGDHPPAPPRTAVPEPLTPVPARPAVERPIVSHSARVHVSPPDSFGDGAPTWQRVAVIAAILIVIAAVIGGGIFGARALLGSGSKSAVATPAPTATAATSPSPTGPVAVPVYAPPSVGAVKAVILTLDGPCAIGSSCTVQVQVMFQTQSDSHAVNWGFKIFDRCASTTSDQPGGTVNAQGGWNNTISDSVFTLPAAKGQLAIVAISTAPDRAASQPLLVGPDGC